MLDNVYKTLLYFCDNELKSFNESSYFLAMRNLSEDLGYSVKSSCDYGKFDKNDIYLEFSITDKNGQTIWIEDDGYLCYALRILEIDRKKRIKFFIWEEDEDFLDSIKWAIKNLNLISKKINCED